MMKKFSSMAGILFGCIAFFGLSGCEPMQRAADQAMTEARQSASEALDNAQPSASIDDARQPVVQALEQARQAGAGILLQASEYLATDPRHGQNAADTATPDSDL